MPIREVPISERCKREVCIKEVSPLERRLYWRDVLFRETFVLERRLY